LLADTSSSFLSISIIFLVFAFKERLCTFPELHPILIILLKNDELKHFQPVSQSKVVKIEAYLFNSDEK
jgi:hypothetical protein